MIIKNYSECEYQPIIELICEIKFRPNSRLLDYLGAIAEEAAKLMDMKDWQLTPSNRIDIFNLEKKSKAYVSFRHAGFIIQNEPNTISFINQTEKFISFLFDQECFGRNVFLERIGLRHRIAYQYNDTFESLVSAFSTKYVSLRPAGVEILGGSLIDIGSPFTVKTESGTIHTMVGPMKLDQLKNAIKIENISYPSISLYLDFDYSDKPERELNKKSVIELIKTYNSENNKKMDKVARLLLGC